MRGLSAPRLRCGEKDRESTTPPLKAQAMHLLDQMRQEGPPGRFRPPFVCSQQPVAGGGRFGRVGLGSLGESVLTGYRFEEGAGPHQCDGFRSNGCLDITCVSSWLEREVKTS